MYDRKNFERSLGEVSRHVGPRELYEKFEGSLMENRTEGR
jgi:hypothetical protein